MYWLLDKLRLTQPDWPIYVVGYVGQMIFFSRFVVQWIASERAGRSVIPTPFWLLSLAGSALVLFYALVRKDPVFILAQSVGSLIYVRNLMLLKKERDRLPDGRP